MDRVRRYEYPRWSTSDCSTPALGPNPPVQEPARGSAGLQHAALQRLSLKVLEIISCILCSAGIAGGLVVTTYMLLHLMLCRDGHYCIKLTRVILVMLGRSEDIVVSDRSILGIKWTGSTGSYTNQSCQSLGAGPCHHEQQQSAWRSHGRDMCCGNPSQLYATSCLEPRACTRPTRRSETCPRPKCPPTWRLEWRPGMQCHA
jgi:hypothetical protein